MALELEQLQRALAQNAQATQGLAGMDEKLAMAQALRQPNAQQNQQGYTSPLAIMADVLGQSRGRQQERTLRPQQEQLRSQLAEGEGAVQGHALEQSMAKRAEQALKSTQGTEAHALKMATNAGKAETWVDKDGNEINVAYDNQNKPYDVATDKTPDPKYHEKERTFGLGSGGLGKQMGTKDLKAFAESGNQVRKVGDVVSRFEGRFVQPTGFGTETLNKLILNASTADILKYASTPGLDDTAKDAAAWWGDWKMTYELIQRHKLFGATLTNNEMASWKEAVHLLQGMEPARAEARINKLMKDLQEDLANETNAQMSLSARRPWEQEALEGVMTNAGYNRGEDGKFTYGQPEAEAPPQIAGMSEKQSADFAGLPPEAQARIMAKLREMEASGN